VNETKNVKQKVVITGDSRASNCAAELQYCLDTTFAVSSFVKPSAGKRLIADTVEEDL
jgi:hypothetical protein